MTLRELEFALRPQFLWDPENDWKNPKENQKGFVLEGATNLGIMVFIGLATLHDFKPEHIRTRLNLSTAKYDALLHRYKTHLKEAIASNYILSIEDERRLSTTVYTKTKLVQSCLQLKYGAPRINFLEVFND